MSVFILGINAISLIGGIAIGYYYDKNKIKYIYDIENTYDFLDDINDYNTDNINILNNKIKTNINKQLAEFNKDILKRVDINYKNNITNNDLITKLRKKIIQRRTYINNDN